MGTRVLSLWLPYLAIDRLRYEGRRAAPGQQRLPLATFDGKDEHAPLIALCPRAEQAGLHPGMARSDALERVPGLVLHPVDAEGERQCLRRCLSWCERHTPFIAVDHSAPFAKGAALWLDIGNAAHLAGGEASLLAHLLARFQKEGVQAKAAIADHPGSAWAACRFGGEEQRILPANGARVALAPWPIAALRLDEADCARLESEGLERIEHLYALPRRALAARFGDHAATRLDQALGLVDEPIAAHTPLPAQQAQMIFAEPILSPDALPPLIERLLRQLCIGLEAAGLGARRLTLALYRVDNSTITCSIGTDRPTRDMHRLQALIGDRFDAIDLGFGLERIILDAVEIEPVLPESIRWRGLGTAADNSPPDFSLTIGVIDGGRGERPEGVARPPAWRETHVAQSAPRPIPPFLDPAPVRLPARRSSAAGAALALSPPEIEQQPLRETAPRPLRLLRQPEPIEAIASLPGEPPVLFRWRQRLHKVIRACGPETVAPDWWRLPDTERSLQREQDRRCQSQALTPRDYFAVEDSDHARFWLFREGRYETDASPLPRWFLHGIFG